jgi:hypothetical protein
VAKTELEHVYFSLEFSYKAEYWWHSGTYTWNRTLDQDLVLCIYIRIYIFINYMYKCTMSVCLFVCLFVWTCKPNESQWVIHNSDRLEQLIIVCCDLWRDHLHFSLHLVRPIFIFVRRQYTYCRIVSFRVWIQISYLNWMNVWFLP